MLEINFNEHLSFLWLFLVEVNDFDFEIDLNKHLKCSFTTASRKFCSANDKVSEGKRQNIAAFCF